ncbi:MAG: hypothetical protein KatS3mg008_1427 [Acidimicrobiales bacterium]|nr:MAG: hypothetical protein KatS3mg008_1427 [Acidimicrobiales bacterium]
MSAVSRTGRAALSVVAAVVLLWTQAAWPTGRASSQHRESTATARAAASHPLPGPSASGSGVTDSSVTGLGPLRLVQQSPFVSPGQNFLVEVAVSGPTPSAGVDFEVVLGARIRSRIQFLRGLETPSPRGRRLGFRHVPELGIWIFDPKAPTTVRVERGETVQLVVPVVPSDAAVAGLDLEEGVHPLWLVPVRPPERERPRQPPSGVVTTHIVRMPDRPEEAETLDVALIVPVHSAPAIRDDGRSTIPAERRQILVDTLTTLAARDVPLTILPTPHTVSVLAENDKARSLLRDAAEGRQVATGPFVRLPAAALLESESEDRLSEALRLGRRLLRSYFDGNLDYSTWVATGEVTPQLVSFLVRAGVSRVVLPSETLRPLDDRLFPRTLTRPFGLDEDSGGLLAFAADPNLAAHARADDPVAAAHQFLADLFVLFFDSPGVHRSVVVHLDDDLPDPSFFDVVLAALSSARVLRPVTLDEAFEFTEPARAAGETAREGEILRRALARSSSEMVDWARDRTRLLGRAEVLVSALRAALPRESPVVRRAETVVMAAMSEEIDPGVASEYVEAVRRVAQSTLGALRIPDQVVTITSREARIPLQLNNLGAERIRIRVMLTSDKLQFPDGATLDVEVRPGSVRIPVLVRTRSSGTFPVRIDALTPEEDLSVDRATLTINSRAVSGLGVFLSILCALFLAAWWLRHFRRTRRDRRLMALP